MVHNAKLQGKAIRVGETRGGGRSAFFGEATFALIQSHIGTTVLKAAGKVPHIGGGTRQRIALRNAAIAAHPAVVRKTAGSRQAGRVIVTSSIGFTTAGLGTGIEIGHITNRTGLIENTSPNGRP